MTCTFSSLFYGPVPQLPQPSPAQLEQLRQQAIALTAPGTILRDFQTVLEFVGSNGLEVSSTHHFLCPDTLEKLNARLTHPSALDLKRSPQKCYPQIHGLYLLLRASGLGRIESHGKKHWLVLEQSILESWNCLNPTERYFTLLEAWLIWGNDEILGEPLNMCRRFFDNLGRCLILWPYIPDQGLPLQDTDQQELAHCPGLHNLALLEMFGLITVQSAQPEPGKGWRLEAIQRSAWGDALIHFLADWAAQELQRIDGQLEQTDNGFSTAKEAAREAMFGRWQSAFQSWFPEWQHNLEIPQHLFQDGVYTFKISLCTIWRRIAIPATASLDALSDIILKSVDFDENQLYCFSFKNQFGWTFRINHPFLQEGPYTYRVRIGELPLHKGSKLTYLFDFGEHWEFDIKLERIDPPDPSLKKPKIIEYHGEPPEQYPALDEDEMGWNSEEASV